MTLVPTIVSLAHDLKITVVAEGVEAEGQEKLARFMRRSPMQGDLVSTPLTFAESTTCLGRARA